ncbi:MULTISPECIES: endonuclease/exonuclease/phosphatase family protein [unclassified Streptomyces]|uniref:endonuclease/exonuclease/phosphatase family protein n=1 Tax=unclassified Streptomyces TaxID=2593676 RepID=UPI000F6ED546|nr:MULTISPECIES: endonuclease/exonuclease/phosphatase family protein [unclassified Streptomyces]AZM64074.1 metal-dependent hydrolase [Streptomyces sp. WAC 01438]RSM88164.1 metal-dependent hydrolase [Streptomyces sp. WAC 01420]
MTPRFRRPVRTGRLATVLAAVLFATAAPATAAGHTAGSRAPAVPLRVVTYNIHAGAGQDQVFDLDRTAAALRGLHADVIGLQEVDVHWGARSAFVDEARALARTLRMRVFFAPVYDLEPADQGGERRQFGVAVLSRHPVLHAENHEITRLSTQTPDPVPAPGPGFAEVVVGVRGARVHVYSTHLDYRADPSVRAAQVADMLAVLAADRGPRVLVGDFNAEATAPELAPLWRTLRDAAPDGGATYPADVPVKRIDLVTVSPDITVAGARTVATRASDHRPVVADLKVHRRGH